MSKELELAGLDAAAAEAGHAASAQPAADHADCLNCGARLQGAYCHVCGQTADSHHRSIGHLIWEVLEGFTHLDSRVAMTLPALLFHPGRLALDQIEGRRQRHVPPFRLFLITLLLFMLAAEVSVSYGHAVEVGGRSAPAAAPRSFRTGDVDVVVTDPSHIQQALDQAEAHGPVIDWLKTHAVHAAQNHELYMTRVFEWAHRLAVLLLPILAGLLTLSYLSKKELFVYDHLVVAMQYLSFCFLLWAVVFIMPGPISGLLTLPALIWTPFNLYQILRTAYGSGRMAAVLKATTLWVCTVTVFGVLLTALLVLVLNQM